jgi:hypothetical protein
VDFVNNVVVTILITINDVAETSDEAIRRLAILVEKRHILPQNAQSVVNRLLSKIEGLFQYLDHDIPKQIRIKISCLSMGINSESMFDFIQLP